MKRQLQSSKTSSWHDSLSCSYQDQCQIEEISAREYGNPLIARGAFGEVSIAVKLPTPSTRGSSSSSSSATTNTSRRSYGTSSACSQYEYVAIKTIRNAVTYNNEKSSHEFTPTVFAELASLRALTRSGTESESDSESPHPNILPLLCIKYDASKKKNDNGDSSNDSSDSAGGGFIASSGHSLFSSTTLSFVFPYCPCDLQEIISHRRYNYSRNNGSNAANCNNGYEHGYGNDNQYHKKIFTKPFMKCIMRDICNGLEYCHSQGIIHCDIKPGNIVLSSNGFFQLADFGIARLYKRNQKSPASTSVDTANGAANANADPPKNDHKGLCTLYYRPPELLYGSTTYEPSMDMWGVGLILTELCTLRPLFPGATVLDQLSKIMDVLGTPTDDSWPKARMLPDYHKVKFDCRDGVGLRKVVPCLDGSDGCGGSSTSSDGVGKFQLTNLVESLVVMDPEKRLTAAQCLAHPWMTHWGNYCSGRGSNSDGSGDETSSALDSFFGLTKVDSRRNCGHGAPANSREFMIQNMVFNKDVLGDDILMKSLSSSIVEGSTLEDNNEELLDQIKLKGVAIAEVRRTLGSTKNKFHLPEMKAFCEENDMEESVNDTTLQSNPHSEKADIATLLGTRMRENCLFRVDP